MRLLGMPSRWGALAAVLLLITFAAGAPADVRVQLTLDDARAAYDVARTSDVPGTVHTDSTPFFEKYNVHFPLGPAEQADSVELHTPFRDAVARALANIRANQIYDEYRVLRDVPRQPPALRILVRLVLNRQSFWINPLMRFGQSYRVKVSYALQDGGTVTVEPHFAINEISSPGDNSTIYGSFLEMTLSLEQAESADATKPPALPPVDPRGVLTVTILEPTGASRTARFDLGKLQ